MAMTFACFVSVLTLLLRGLLPLRASRGTTRVRELQGEGDTFVVRAPDLLLAIGRHFLDCTAGKEGGEDLVARSALEVRRDRQDEAALALSGDGKDLALGLG
jgi:hypothetical protein